MKRRELIKLLLDGDMADDVCILNVNAVENEFDNDTVQPPITSIGDVEDGVVAIYYVGQVEEPEDE